MTIAEKRYVANEVIATLNTALVRCVVATNGREKTLPKLAANTLIDDFSEISEPERDEIVQTVCKAAIHSQYPNKRIALLGSKLNLGEILLLSDLNKIDIVEAANVLEQLINVMGDNEDGRAQELGKAFGVCKEILQSAQEPVGENI